MVKDLKFNLAGKIIIAVCTLVAAAFCVFSCLNSLVPHKFKIIICIGLGVLYGLFMLTQFARPKALRIIVLILAIILSLVLAVGTYYLIRVQETLNSVTSDVVYKTDNMIVVAPSDSEMENIDDAKEVVFGIQTAADIENTSKMIAHLESYYGTALKIKEYENINELIDALLKGEIDVIIYNDAFSDIIADTFADYINKVKILHQYGIKIEVEMPEQEEIAPDNGSGNAPAGFDITKDPFCVYISGIDVSGPISVTSRSDVNIIMAVNPTTKKILLVTTPRDYYVPIPGVSGGVRDKLTHAGIYGVNASMNTLAELYDVSIKYYVRVNFTSLKTVVDALGGVEVQSDYAFKGGSYYFTKGTNFLDGDRALSFCRERKSFADGDNQRGKNQQIVLTAILKKAMTPAVLTKANDLLTAVGGCMETNMTPAEIGKLVEMQLSDMATWDIKSEAASGISDINTCYSLGSYEVYVMWPNETSVEDIIKKLHRILGR